MKHNYIHLVLTIICMVVCCTTSQASTSAPMFAGDSINVPEVSTTFYWNNATEANGQHIDYYKYSSYTATVTGMINNPNLATVTGNRGQFRDFDGFLQNGVYAKRDQSYTDMASLSLNGKTYTSLNTHTVYTIVLETGSLTSSATRTYFGPGVTLAVAPNGSLTGAETGYLINGSWYVNNGKWYLGNGTWYLNSTVTSAANLTLPNGHVYTSYAYKTTYTLNGSGQAVPVISETYSQSNGTSFTVAADGTISGAETGYVVSGSWYVNKSTNITIDYTSPNGRHYTADNVVTTYTRNGEGQIVESKVEYVSGGGNAFTVAADGTISGSEGGLAVDGTWYLNHVHDSTTVDYTSPQGTHYILRSLIDSYVSDGNGGATSVALEVYSTDSSYHTSDPQFTVDANGRISGSETGYKISGNWYINGNSTVPNSGLSSISILGTSFTFSQGTASYGFDSENNPTSTHWTDTYLNSEGGSAQISYAWAAGDAQPVQQLTGSDLYVGSFVADYTGGINNLVWQARTAPSFTQSTLYLNGTLLSWQSGTVNTAGEVTDTYGPNTAGQTLVIKGSMRSFMQGSSSADVSVNGSSIGTYAYQTQFNFAGWDLEVSAPNRDWAFFGATTLWVNGNPYVYSRGYADENGNIKDVYLASGGTVNLIGYSSDSSNATVQVNSSGEIHTGTATFMTNGGGFNVPGVTISAIPPETGPPAFWVGGVFYLRQSGTNRYTSVDSLNTLTLGGTNSGAMQVSGMQGGSAITGIYGVSLGVFTVALPNGSLLPACPAQANGSHLANNSTGGCPPAMRVGTEVWDCVGVAVNDITAYLPATYYANARHAAYTGDPSAAPTSNDHHRLLKICIDTPSTATVTVTDYSNGTSSTGTYSMSTHLVQSSTSSPLPMPIYAVDPNANDTPWQMPAPPAGGSNALGSGPATLLVGNQVWRYAGVGNDGAALYQGYFPGQQLTLGAANAGGVRTITVTDPVNGNATGMLNDVNGSTTLSNGQTINSGTPSGVQMQPQNVATVSGDLAVPGSLLTIGSLNGDTTTAGATLQFSDSGSQAMFGSALGRSAAQWVWWRVDPANSASFVPTMVVDSSFGLVLYDSSFNPPVATVKLNPTQGSVSELPRLKLSSQQTLDEDGSVLTRVLGDGRYLRMTGSSQSLAIGSGINVNTATWGNTNSAPAYSAAIGQNLQAASGQVVVGQNSTAASDQVFIVGAGSSSYETKNALTVSTSGNTTLNGTLTVTGAAALTSATVSGTLTVGGQPVLTQDAADDLYIRVDQIGGGGNSAILTQDTADTRYLQNSQSVRTPPAGETNTEDQATIAADLDIVGNSLTLGVLSGDASRAGGSFEFTDDASTASLHSVMGRPLAQWVWWKTDAEDPSTLRQVMRLDAEHRLKLYKATDAASPAITLDPAGTSSFKGPVRVPQSGDIPMGAYEEGDPP